MTQIEKLVEHFFEHQTLLKMYHFQTKLYGAHKAVDAYLILFAQNMDRFMEAAQGEFGRLKNGKINISLTTVTEKTVDKELKKFISILDKKIPHSCPDLLAIRDEMVADVQQLRYLLTFK